MCDCDSNLILKSSDPELNAWIFLLALCKMETSRLHCLSFSFFIGLVLAYCAMCSHQVYFETVYILCKLDVKDECVFITCWLLAEGYLVAVVVFLCFFFVLAGACLSVCVGVCVCVKERE